MGSIAKKGQMVFSSHLKCNKKLSGGYGNKPAKLDNDLQVSTQLINWAENRHIYDLIILDQSRAELNKDSILLQKYFRPVVNRHVSKSHISKNYHSLFFKTA